MLRLFETERLFAFVVDEGAARQLLAYERENRQEFSTFSPVRNESYYTQANFEYMCGRQAALYEQKRKLPLVFSRKEGSAIVAQVYLSDITYGASYSARLGYSTAKRWQRQGIGGEAVQAVIGYAFTVLKLHRLEATINTRNIPSLEFASSLRFVQEGVSRQYLLLNGVWEDYCQLALLNEQRQGGRRG
ncbi:MAG: GNAT family protein [Sphaerochaeta sp.]|nr:GNAT family protein [Sphaerochaeta sp.]